MTDQQSQTALIVVDVQRAFDEWEAAGKRRNNPDAVARIVDLLAAFRDSAAPIFHIRHEGTKPTSSFLPGGTGYRREGRGARTRRRARHRQARQQRLHRHGSGEPPARGRHRDAS